MKKNNIKKSIAEIRKYNDFRGRKTHKKLNKCYIVLFLNPKLVSRFPSKSAFMFKEFSEKKQLNVSSHKYNICEK